MHHQLEWKKVVYYGRTGTSEAELSGCSVEVATSETTEEIHDSVLAVLRVREIVKLIGTLHNPLVLILNENSGMKKLRTKWVPHLYTIDDKREGWIRRETKQ